MVLRRFGQKFSEQRVCPGEPSSCEVSRIVSVVGLMDEASCCGGCLQRLDHMCDLSGGVRRQGIEDLRHWPDTVAADMWTADSFAGGASEEPGILFAPDEAASSRVESRIRGAIKIRKA